MEEPSNSDSGAEVSLLKAYVCKQVYRFVFIQFRCCSLYFILILDILGVFCKRIIIPYYSLAITVWVVSQAGTSIMTSSFGDDNNVMPTSLSQVDVSVLEQLPEEMKLNILELLPAHRGNERTDMSPRKPSPREPYHVDYTGNQHGSSDSVLHDELFIGDPPRWVDRFKLSSCVILNIIADMYFKSGSTGLLSSILQQTMSDYRFTLSSTDGLYDAISCLTELLKQYIKLKIEMDIEEIYSCFRLLKRYNTEPMRVPSLTSHYCSHFLRRRIALFFVSNFLVQSFFLVVFIIFYFCPL